MYIHFLRHATLLLTINDLTLLVDPMLSPLEAMGPIANAGNQQRIPMVPLPVSDADLQQILQRIDAVLVTHTHRDHWRRVDHQRFTNPSTETVHSRCGRP